MYVIHLKKNCCFLENLIKRYDPTATDISVALITKFTGPLLTSEIKAQRFKSPTVAGRSYQFVLISLSHLNNLRAQ